MLKCEERRWAQHPAPAPVLPGWRDSPCCRGRCEGWCKEALPQDLVPGAQRAAGDGKGKLSCRRLISLGLQLEVCVQNQDVFIPSRGCYCRLGSSRDLPVLAVVHLKGLGLMITQTTLQ